MDISWETSKEQLRQRAKKTLASLSPEDKKKQSEYVCEKLYEYINTYNNRAVYLPFSYEPDIFSFVQQLREQQKVVLLPQLDGDTLRLAYYTRDSIIVQWTYGEWIIQNPVWYDWPVDVCLIPWLVFDSQWRRIGHGKWWYDRFLATNSCYRIGLWYKEIMKESIPHDHWDQKMDVIIADNSES